MAYTLALGASGRKAVEVQVLSPAPKYLYKIFYTALFHTVLYPLGIVLISFNASLFCPARLLAWLGLSQHSARLNPGQKSGS